ncbi:hypothetical protein KIN20_018650 [Parelaphostrongylus tenuis]|uniref:Caveolin n=1 Tax=Parelaphostrongylus tenuis TaxID=148309 RepID=A0AAD5MJV8_PARTN|nr:hypothetical protein KIN20_018650 [Parelaphostrongylus tenuis]
MILLYPKRCRREQQMKVPTFQEPRQEMSKRSSSASLSQRISRGDEPVSHAVEEEHKAPAPLARKKIKNVDKAAPAPEDVRCSMPAESSPPNITKLPMRSPKSDTQMVFDLNTDAYMEVITSKLNMIDRDEHKLNTDLQISFFYIFGEPDEQYRSVACVWTSSYRVFELTRIYGYKILTLILALPVSFFAGLIFALFSFLRIWIVQPLLALLRIVLRQLITIWPLCVIYIVRPFFYSVGAVFSTVRLHRSEGTAIREVWETV